MDGRSRARSRTARARPLGRLPQVYGGVGAGAVAAPARQSLDDGAGRKPTRLKDEFVSTEHLLLALAGEAGRDGGRAAAPAARRHADRVLEALDVGARHPARDRPESRGQVPGARALRARPDRARAQGQARPGHRPRRGNPPRHPGALAPHEEQPGADRRARRRQDGHRRGPRPAHRPRRRAGGAEEQADRRRSTWARWSPARSTAASSRSG